MDDQTVIRAQQGDREAFAELVEAFGLLHEEIECELLLVGFSDAANSSAVTPAQLESWSQQPGIRYLPPTDEPQQVLATADCLVLPSYREGLPRSLLEAGAMAIPVIASDVPGCREVVTDGDNGLLCQPADSHSLLQALHTMATMPSGQREQMGLAGRRRVLEKFDQKIVIDAYLDAINSALAKPDP